MKKALEHLLKYFDLNRLNGSVNDRLQFYLARVNENDPLFIFDEALLSRLKMAVSLIRSSGLIQPGDDPAGHILSVSNNSRLNDFEFNNKRLLLNSSPKKFFIEANGLYGKGFIFDKPNSDYDMFSLKSFRPRFEKKALPFMSTAEEIIFLGNGEFFLLPELKDLLDYFDKDTPNSTKVFFTNGFALSPDVCEDISACKSKLALNVLLPAFNEERYVVMANNDNMPVVLKNLRHLLKMRKDPDKLEIIIFFTATTLNIEQLPDLVKLSADLGVDKIICRYAAIYHEVQRYLSCFFRQHATNEAINRAAETAKKLNLKIDLPPRFGWNDDYQKPGLCRSPWSQITLDVKGRVSLCARLNKFVDSIELKAFSDVWNGEGYQRAREIFAEKNCPCHDFCIEANPSAVNKFDAHCVNCEKACDALSEVFKHDRS